MICRELSNGMILRIDKQDAYLLDEYGWYACQQGRTWYAFANERLPGRARIIRLHRLIVPTPPGLVVDHINCDGLDNRRSNLRVATRSQNAANASAHTDRVSGSFKGVTRCSGEKKRPWRATIMKAGVIHRAGCFETQEDAARAYDAMAHRLFGEYARPNFTTSGA